jgi:hypothetical protein
VLELGERELPLTPGCFAVEIRGGRLWFEAWDEASQLSRRILEVEDTKPGRLDCSIHRFGGKPGRLSFLDLDRPGATLRSLQAARQNFAEHFRRMLARQFPGWKIVSLSAGMDLQRSFSPVYPRARLAKGSRAIAALGCPALEDEPALLTFGLIWHDHVARTLGEEAQTSLVLFVPEGAGSLTANRLNWLQGALLRPRLFVFNQHGWSGEVDGRDLGNLETRLNSRSQSVSELPAPDGFSSYQSPERCLEMRVCSHLSAIDPNLRPYPIYRQVLTFAGGDRDLVDLLAQFTDGRLGVLELKASEDIHLPIQALDYWMRIKWHSEKNELNQFFPQLWVPNVAAKMFLIAPAMSFHPANTTVLRYFLPSIEVERVGVSLDWQHNFRVTLRLKGAAMPMSHGPTNGDTRTD